MAVARWSWRDDGAADGQRDAVVGQGAGGEGGFGRGDLALLGEGGADIDEDRQGALAVGQVELGGGVGR